MKKRLKVITAFLLMIVMAASGSYVFAGTDAQPAEDEMQAALDVMEEGEAPADDAAAAEDEVLPEEAVQVEAVSEEAVPEEAATPEEEMAAAETVTEPLAPVEEEENVSLMDMQLMESNSLSAKTLNYTAPKRRAESLTWKPCSFSGTTNGDWIMFTVNVKTSGKLWFDVQKFNCSEYGALVFVGKYNPSTKKITKYTGLSSAFLNSETTKASGLGGLNVVAGGSYCIGVDPTVTDRNINISFNVRPYVYSYATRTLTAGKIMMAEGYKTGSDGYLKDSAALFKIKPSKTGYIRVYFANYGYNPYWGDVTLLNSSKKAVSNKLSYYKGSSGSYVAFGVKKGVTYYLKVSGCMGTSANLYVYGISYKIYASKLRSNTSKSKATKLKRKAKYITAAMPATGKSGNQWFKFKVTKKRATRISIDARNIKSGTVKAVFYCGKKKLVTVTISKGAINHIDLTYSTTYNKAKKGTYYVKIMKSGKANGAYKIKYTK